MNRDELNTLLIVVLTFLVVGVFFFAFDKIGTLSTDVQNMKLRFDLSEKNNQIISEPTQTSAPASKNSTSTENNGKSSTLVKIPTAILFETQSSPALSPQTTLSVAIQDVARDTDGTFTIYIKIFTNNAPGYSAINLKSVLQVISFDGENIQVTETNGQFGSMPPKSATTGNIVFKTDPQKTTVILQVGNEDNAKFYEFNFTKKTYRETTVG